MTQSLLSLYHTILVFVLSEWIGDEDLCTLDIAVCNHGLRDPFLFLLSKCYVVNTNITHKFNEERYPWMLLRGIGMRKVCLKTEVSDLSPQLLLLLKATKHLHYLEAPGSIDLQELIVMCDLKIHTLKLLSSVCDQDLEGMLKLLPGLQLLDISKAFGLSDKVYANVIACCRELNGIGPPLSANIRPVLENCECKQIIHGDLIRLFGPTDSYGSMSKYFGDLHQVHEFNSSVVSMAGKSYHIKSLEVLHGTSDDHVNFLVPFLSHITSFRFESSTCSALLDAVAQRCSKITSLTLVDVSIPSIDLMMILQHSSQLLHLELLNCRQVNQEFLTVTSMNPAVYATVAEHCRLLRSLKCIGVYMKHQDVACIIDACRHLKDIIVDYTTEAVTHTPMDAQVVRVCTDIESLVVNYHSYYRTVEVVHRSHRKLREATLTGFISKMSTVLLANPGLLSLEINNHMSLQSETIEVIVRLCPQLTRLVVNICTKVTHTCLVHIAKLVHLRSLYLSDQRKITDEMVDTLLRDKPHFTKLALPYSVSLTGESLRSIARHCGHSIRHVDLTSNKNISSADVVTLLLECRSIDSLNLEGCTNVTKDIFVALRSMRYLNVARTGINKDELASYVKSEGLQFSCELCGSLKFAQISVAASATAVSDAAESDSAVNAPKAPEDGVDVDRVASVAVDVCN